MKNPPNGGIPLIENTNKANINAIIGSDFFNSLNEIKKIEFLPIYKSTNHIINELRIYTAK